MRGVKFKIFVDEEAMALESKGSGGGGGENETK